MGSCILFGMGMEGKDSNGQERFASWRRNWRASMDAGDPSKKVSGYSASDHDAEDGAGAGLPEDLGAFFECGAGRCDIVDEPDILIQDVFFLALSDDEGVFQVAETFGAGVGLHLRPGVALSQE